MRRRYPKCLCGHTRSWHFIDDGRDVGCLTNRCCNVCQSYRPEANLPRPGERIVFGTHTLPPERAQS
jgi:hypothetical protein